MVAGAAVAAHPAVGDIDALERASAAFIARVAAPKVSEAVNVVEADPEWLSPPPGAIEEVDRELAEEAWRDVAALLAGACQAAGAVVRGEGGSAGTGTDGGEGEAGAGGAEGEARPDLPGLKELGRLTESLERFYGSLLNSEAVLLGLHSENTKFMAAMMKAGMDNLRYLTETQQAAVEEKLRKELEQAKKQEELNKKATKGQIFSVTLSYVFAAAQVVGGAFKCACGQYGGVFDITAGLLGMARTTLEVIQMANPDSAKGLEKHIANLGYAELAFSGAAALTSIVSIRSIYQGGQKAINGAATRLLGMPSAGGGQSSSLGNTLVRAFQKADQLAANALKPGLSDAARTALQTAAEQQRTFATELMKATVKEVAAECQESLAKAVSRFPASDRVLRVFAKAFNSDAVETMVEKALKSSVEAMQKLPPGSAERISRQFLKEFSKSIQSQVLSATLHHARLLQLPIAAVSVVQTAGNMYVGGVLRLQGADIKAEIDLLNTQILALSFQLNSIDRRVREKTRAMEQMNEEYVRQTKDISAAIRESKDVAVQIAGNLA
ncbi:hypothetical protein [Cupriavidus sp. AU9028]|uniref:hypothetical protein n=1 Tax=Cupriavidus sp. AU9028 TaxID=2871157 RepID=UPI001C9811D3|nr:hypothetical protein [Cupriavidus sp. AU9028]MBY4897894.1 hypothetical protein [Cupriavidus sp. AU9028]